MLGNYSTPSAGSEASTKLKTLNVQFVDRGGKKEGKEGGKEERREGRTDERVLAAGGRLPDSVPSPPRLSDMVRPAERPAAGRVRSILAL